MSKEDLNAQSEASGGYILVDFDRTLSIYRGWNKDGTKLGPPVPAMVERVQRWLHSGVEVRIFTARASRYDIQERAAMQAWLKEYIGQELKIQNWKCFDCIAIWDDLAVAVEPNTGFRDTVYNESDPLNPQEEEELVDLALAQLEA